MSTDAVVGSGTSSESQTQSRVQRGRYAIYKPLKSGKGCALTFEINTQMPAVFVEIAGQVSAEQRRFDWEKKVVMKWGLADIGEIVAALDGNQKEAKLFHQTDKGNTAFDLRHQSDREPANFSASMSRQRSGAKDVTRFRISISQGEAAVLLTVLRQSVLVLSRWLS